MQGHYTERIKMDARDYKITCLQCGNIFEAQRDDATFCSTKCRIAYHREPEKVLSTIKMIDTFGSNLLTLAARYKYNHNVFNAVLALQKVVNMAIGIFEIDGHD
jgi:hypothetical protein